MTHSVRAALTALPALVWSAVASAAPYTLPSGPGVLQAKLSGPLPSYAVVCDSLAGSACDVLPGDYQLQVFDREWKATKRTVTVTGGGPVAGPLPLFIIREQRSDATFLAPSCGGTARAIGGSCAATVDGVAVPLSMDTTALRVGGGSRENPNTSPGSHSCATSVRATIAAEVVCLAD